MAGYPFNSKYLVTMVARLLGRPVPADTLTVTEYCDRLTEAQQEVVADIATVIPEVLYPTVSYSNIPTMTTVDNQTFTYGTDDNGFPLAPIGDVALYRNLNDIPGYPMVLGQDFIPLGGTAIQVPNNQTYIGTIYWRGIAPPGVIDTSGNHEPVLFPEGSRELIALRAAYNLAGEAALRTDVMAIVAARYGYPLAGNPGRFAYWCQVWRSQYAGGGALQSVSGLQIASGSFVNYGGA